MKFEFIIRLEMKGLQWKYTTDDGKHGLSIICHNGSYGGESGLFETQCSWLPDVQGHLTFEQVVRKIKHIEKLDIDKDYSITTNKVGEKHGQYDA